MPPVRKPESAVVTDGHVIYVHPDHVDGLHAPDAAGLAENGVPTASARPVPAGEPIPAEVTDSADLERIGAVHRDG